MGKWVNAVPSTQEALWKQRLKLLPLLGWNGLPCDPSSLATSSFSHRVILNGDPEIPGVAPATYVLSLPSASSEKADTCQGVRMQGHMTPGSRRRSLELCNMLALL